MSNEELEEIKRRAATTHAQFSTRSACKDLTELIAEVERLWITLDQLSGVCTYWAKMHSTAMVENERLRAESSLDWIHSPGVKERLLSALEEEDWTGLSDSDAATILDCVWRSVRCDQAAGQDDSAHRTPTEES